jgi:hypothetical protein
MSQMGDRSQILDQQMPIQALAGSSGHELKSIVMDATDFTLAYLETGLLR